SRPGQTSRIQLSSVFEVVRAESLLTPGLNWVSVRLTVRLFNKLYSYSTIGGEAVKRCNKVARAVGILSCLIIGLMFMGYEAPVVSAQVLYGSVVGTVTDRAGA